MTRAARSAPGAGGSLAPSAFVVGARHVVVAAVAVLIATPALASAPDLFGAGPRAGALGGTGIAFSDDWEATYENPAGLAFARARRLTIGFLGADSRLRLDGADHPNDATNGLYLGVALPIPLGGALADRVVLGLAFYLPVGVVNRARSPFFDVPRLAVIDDRTQTVSLSLALGVRLARTLSLGVGVLALAALVGEIDLAADSAGRWSTSSEEQLIASYAPLAGVRWDPTPMLQLGLSLRGESLSRYDIRVTSDLSNVIPFFALPTLRIAGVSQYDPLQLAVEGALRPAPSWIIAVGVGWARWSAFPLPVELATMVPSPPPPGFTPPAQPGFHDTVMPRAGVEWTLVRGPLRAALRAGYFYAQSPAPSGAAQKQLDADRHVVTAGFDLSIDNRWVPLHATAFGQWHQLLASDRVSGSIAVLGASLGFDL